MAQIQIEKLTFTYALTKNQCPAIRNISLDINRGEFVVVCGKTGCGKSTLLRNLKPAIRPIGNIAGKVVYNGHPIDSIDERTQAAEIGFVMQNPNHQIVTDKVWHEMAFGLENIGIRREDIRLRITEMAEYFGIVDWYDLKVEQLSGGQKQLMNLAAIMAMHPEILVLDEPTAQLDPIAAENFIDVLKKINEDLGITILLSEHRLNLVLPKADKVVIMDNGEVTICGTPKEVVDKISDSSLLKFMPIPTQIFKYCNEKGPVPISVADGRKWMENKSVKSNIFEKPKMRAQTPAIICKNVWFRYERKSQDIIQNLNVTINEGEIFAILGGNGTGKTTTMLLLSGTKIPYRGKIKKFGKTALLPQDVQTLFTKETVREELEGIDWKIIEAMELEALKERHPYDISGGQQQKLALAKLLKENPDILLLDEPTKAIDPIYKEQLGCLLRELAGQGKTIIIVSHDVDFCGEYADRCGMFARGSLIAINHYREFFAAKRFYTTTVHKMSGRIMQDAVRMEEVICRLMK